MRISDWSSDVCSSDLVAISPQHPLLNLHLGEVYAKAGMKAQARKVLTVAASTDGFGDGGKAKALLSRLSRLYRARMRFRVVNVMLHAFPPAGYGIVIPIPHQTGRTAAQTPTGKD